uniref:Reverse transcriptase Ty1/copia-type domain-containing protein n=1 Tax=Trichuris muris TaxID=70415 RepID=A0A5S6R247_TRIMR
MYCRLLKSLYGLKQSGRCWNEHLDRCLKELGFQRNQVDSCVYTLTLKEGNLVLCVYVDDMLLMSENEHVREKAKQLLNEHFECKHLGKVSYFLGVKFSHFNDGCVTLTQEAYIQRLLQRYRMQDAKGVNTPMEMRPFFTDKGSSEETTESLPYKELIGSLLYLAQRTRPDISFAVAKLSQYCSNFTEQHWTAAKRVSGYLKQTKGLGITYRPTYEPLTAYTDADWASCIETRKSTTGYIVLLSGAPVLWKSAKQTVTALSTMEAEYIALSECTREVTWSKRFLESIEQGRRMVADTTKVYCDSQAAIANANNSADKTRTKHISIRYHFVREKVEDGTIEPLYVRSGRNLEDILTKP